jgi:UDP-N-acetylmuramoyl-tripeptide--D-alanyl-D-alanine ligase
MYELEHEAEKEHRAIGQLIQQKRFTNVYLCGKLFRTTAELIPEAKYFESKSALAENLKERPLTNATILIKASRGIGLETIVEHL